MDTMGNNAVWCHLQGEGSWLFSSVFSLLASLAVGRGAGRCSSAFSPLWELLLSGPSALHPPFGVP